MASINSGKSHRRRKAATTEASQGKDNNKNDDYYYDDDDNEAKIRKSACSLGKFFLNPCLCMISSGRRCCHNLKRASSRAIRKRGLPTTSNAHPLFDSDDWRKKLSMLLGAVISVIVGLHFLFPQMTMRSAQRRLHFHYDIRPTTDADVDRIQIRIPRLDLDNPAARVHDVGGWMYYHKFYDNLEPISWEGPHSGRDYNKLTLRNSGQPRLINPNDAKIAEEYWEENQPKIKRKRKKLTLWKEYAETIQDIPQECRRVNWSHLYNPTCNELHEINLSMDYNDDLAKNLGDAQDFDTFYISHGFYRDVWVVSQPDQEAKSILKTTRFKHDYDIETMFSDLRDALVMERLTKSPRIIDIYGHCGTAVWVEALPYEIEEVIVPGEGYIKQEDLHDEIDVNPQNDYNASEKLEMALAMAESLADLHGFKDGPIIHDDVQLCQWLRTRDGRLKLGDFNRAEIYNYNETKGEYCVYNNGKGYGNVSRFCFIACLLDRFSWNIPRPCFFFYDISIDHRKSSGGMT